MDVALEQSRVQSFVQSTARRRPTKASTGRAPPPSAKLLHRQQQTQPQCLCAVAPAPADVALNVTVSEEAEVQGMSAWLDSLKWDAGGLVTVIAQVTAFAVLQLRCCDRASVATVTHTERLPCSVAH